MVKVQNKWKIVEETILFGNKKKTKIEEELWELPEKGC